LEFFDFERRRSSSLHVRMKVSFARFERAGGPAVERSGVGAVGSALGSEC